MENLLKKVGLKSLTNNYQSYSKGQKREIIELNQKKGQRLKALQNFHFNIPELGVI